MSSFQAGDAIGAALRFTRANARFIAVVALLGAGLTTLVAALGLSSPPLGLLAGLASGVVQAFVYAGLVGAVLYGAGAVPTRIGGDGGRVWAAMAVVAFFLFIVFFIITIPVMITLFAGPLASFLPELEQAGADQEAVLAVMTRFAEANPGVLLLVLLFYSAIWLLLTSRLYLAAPASLEARRILTFETWAWTKGAMLRIAGARLLLLVPANILAGAVGYVFGRLVGVDAFAPTAASNVGGFLAYVFVASFATFALYSALEAGLSSALFRNLKPA